MNGPKPTIHHPVTGPWPAALAILLLTLLAYQPALRAGFIWDDPRYVTENPTLESLEGLVRIWTDTRATIQYYPLVHTSFWIEYHLWGLRPVGYHLVNTIWFQFKKRNL